MRPVWAEISNCKRKLAAGAWGSTWATTSTRQPPARSWTPLYLHLGALGEELGLQEEERIEGRG